MTDEPSDTKVPVQAWADPASSVFLRAARLSELGVQASEVMHELRQPLFAIRAMAQLGVARGGMDAQALSLLLEQVDRLQEQVTSWRHVGGERESEVRLDLNGPVRSALSVLEHRTLLPGVQMELRLAAGALPIRARPVATQQVVVNLLANALDAVEEMAGGRVTVATTLEGDWVRLSVTDSGKGVPPALRGREFEPFVTGKAVGEGSGLGLYITRRLVLEARGELALHPLAAGGTRVEVRLPSAA